MSVERRSTKECQQSKTTRRGAMVHIGCTSSNGCPSAQIASKLNVGEGTFNKLRIQTGLRRIKVLFHHYDLCAKS